MTRPTETKPETGTGTERNARTGRADLAAGVCFSGGKDSTLAALVLEGFYDVTLVTCHFGVTGNTEHARRTAAALDLPFRALELERSVAEAAVDRIDADGFPRNGIQHVHEHALEAVAERFPAVADGTRRDDRVPTVSRATAQSLEDRRGVDYLSPLAGFGRSAVDRLVDATLEIEVGPIETIGTADYETELRALLADRAGEPRVREVFPEHDQTRALGPHGDRDPRGGPGSDEDGR